MFFTSLSSKIVMFQEFDKYDLSPAGKPVYERNIKFLEYAKDSNDLSLEDYDKYLNPRVVDGLFTKAEFRENISIQETELDGIISSLSRNKRDLDSGFGSLSGASKLFRDYYQRASWEPSFEPTDSSRLKQYKRRGPYWESVAEFEEKADINQGRKLPTFFGWAGGIPAAFSEGSAVLAGGGLGFLIGFTFSSAQESRYRARSRGVQKKIEDTLYEEIVENYVEDFGSTKLQII